MFVFSSTGGVYAKQSRRVRGDDDYEAPIAVHSLSKSRRTTGGQVPRLHGLGVSPIIVRIGAIEADPTPGVSRACQPDATRQGDLGESAEPRKGSVKRVEDAFSLAKRLPPCWRRHHENQSSSPWLSTIELLDVLPTCPGVAPGGRYRSSHGSSTPVRLRLPRTSFARSLQNGSEWRSLQVPSKSPREDISVEKTDGRRPGAFGRDELDVNTAVEPRSEPSEVEMSRARRMVERCTSTVQ
jgi:hypothetical protein